jgi:hypothetical protein
MNLALKRHPETNPIEDHRHHQPEPGAERVDWTDPDLARITRLRLLTEPGFPFMDVSYVWGVLKDGSKVLVDVPFDQLPRKGSHREIVLYAEQDGVYAKGLGIFDSISILF